MHGWAGPGTAGQCNAKQGEVSRVDSFLGWCHIVTLTGERMNARNERTTHPLTMGRRARAQIRCTHHYEKREDRPTAFVNGKCGKCGWVKGADFGSVKSAPARPLSETGAATWGGVKYEDGNYRE